MSAWRGRPLASSESGHGPERARRAGRIAARVRCARLAAELHHASPLPHLVGVQHQPPPVAGTGAGWHDAPGPPANSPLRQPEQEANAFRPDMDGSGEVPMDVENSRSASQWLEI
eukprot:3751687-Rhodomonas_salina.1